MEQKEDSGMLLHGPPGPEWWAISLECLDYRLYRLGVEEGGARLSGGSGSPPCTTNIPIKHPNTLTQWYIPSVYLKQNALS